MCRFLVLHSPRYYAKSKFTSTGTQYLNVAVFRRRLPRGISDHQASSIPEMLIGLKEDSEKVFLKGYIFENIVLFHVKWQKKRAKIIMTY